MDLAELGPQLFDRSWAAVRQSVDGVRAERAGGRGLTHVQGQLHRTAEVVPRLVRHHRPDGCCRRPGHGRGRTPHGAAVEVHLRPVLVELGASLPTRGLYVTEEQLESVDDVVAEWLGEAGPRLRAALRED